MSSSDAPQPPGGPRRQDEPDGGFAPDAERTDLPEGGTEHGSDDAQGVPPVSHDQHEQSEDEAALQAENAETSLDQPST